MGIYRLDPNLFTPFYGRDPPEILQAVVEYLADCGICLDAITSAWGGAEPNPQPKQSSKKTWKLTVTFNLNAHWLVSARDGSFRLTSWNSEPAVVQFTRVGCKMVGVDLAAPDSLEQLALLCIAPQLRDYA